MTFAESEASAGSSGPPAAAVLGALPDPVLVVDGNGQVRYANPAAEQFFETGTAVLLAGRLDDLIPADSPLAAVVRQVQESGAGVYEHAAQLSTRRIGPHLLNVQVVPLGDRPRSVVVTLREHSIATKMDRQLHHLGVARSVAGMAAVLAHEVKNPLSGIRGASQLLEQNAADEDRDLTRLICDETDRICGLIDRMELFSDQRPIERGAVNIHEVLEHVRKIGQAGFASRVRFKESYDPSLPPVDGHRDRLVQVFLNLIKNAVEAVADDDIGARDIHRPGAGFFHQIDDECTAHMIDHAVGDDRGDNFPGQPVAKNFAPVFLPQRRWKIFYQIGLQKFLVGQAGGQQFIIKPKLGIGHDDGYFGPR